jgi:hypothetical protein
MEKYDFSGWATRNDLLCSDGRTIRKDAFKHCDGKTVPLVWNHNHSDPDNVLGHALLENRNEGVYAYCSFNNTENAKNIKEAVRHGDVRSLSIFANQLKQAGSDVIHGAIREVSLVLAGANPGAFIDSVMAHGDGVETGIILGYDENIMLYHSEDAADTSDKKEESDKSEEKEETIADVFNTFSEKQKTVVYAMIAKAAEDAGNEEDSKEDSKDDSEGGNDTMKHNVFEPEANEETNVLSHDAMNAIIGDAKRYGSMKESFLQHADTYGIDQIDYLFPDAKNMTNQPIFIQRDMGWVNKVMGSVHHTPFSRIKSIFADITEDEARAKGYIKGKLKKEEVFSLLKRTTTPTTVYKKQKMDRDDVVDITDFDVIAWLKTEMRMMLNEELARAYLVGDGRLASSDDKINESSIRPVWTDEDLYTIKAVFTPATNATADDNAKQFIRTIIKSRKNYKGSGNPVLYTTEDMLTDCLLLTDNEGRDLYDSVEKLMKKLRVSEIVTVPVMEDLTREVEGKTRHLLGILVNLSDYNVGADKGGAVNMFDDFDIDYNQQKYLIETRCSGALTKPFSAIAVEMEKAAG